MIGSWKFIDAQYVFEDPTNPFESTFPTEYNINGLSANEVIDFVGVKMGDLNNSAIPNQLLSGDTRTEVDDLNFKINDQQMEAGKEYHIDFSAKDFTEILGYQFTLGINQELVEFIDIEAGELSGMTMDNFGFTKIDEGIITTSWNSRIATNLPDNAVVFTLKVKAKSAVKFSDFLSIDSRYVEAEAYTEGMELMNVKMLFGNEISTQVEHSFALYQNQPNPFKKETVIGFTLPESTNASLTIYDISGRVLKRIERAYQRGYNEEVVSRSELGTAGLLYYRLETAKDQAILKMILGN